MIKFINHSVSFLYVPTKYVKNPDIIFENIAYPRQGPKISELVPVALASFFTSQVFFITQPPKLVLSLYESANENLIGAGGSAEVPPENSSVEATLRQKEAQLNEIKWIWQ